MRQILAMFALGSLVLSSGACEEEFVPPPRQKEKVDKDNIKKVTTAVPYGKKVACSEIFDEPDKVGAYVGDMVEIKDRSDSEVEATSVCAVMRSGEPPKTPSEADKIKKTQVLGVLPGDEYCTITLYCSRPADLARFKKKCVERGDEGNRDLDQYSCVHTSQRAAKYAYTYETIHKPTECTVRVMGGPSVTDEPLVQNCTKAALNILTKDKLKNYK